MSDKQQGFGFGAFLPGYDFLQQLSGSASKSSAASGWIAPTMNAQEIDKRIEELKAVQFWLEQNSHALSATIQALQVQRMTLSALEQMNVNMGEFAKSFSFAAPTSASAADSATASNWPMQTPSSTSEEKPAEKSAEESVSDESNDQAAEETSTPTADQLLTNQAMQWWGALTQQFQNIAAQAAASMPQTAAPAASASSETAKAKKSPAKKAAKKTSASTGTGTSAKKSSASKAASGKKS